MDKDQLRRAILFSLRNYDTSQKQILPRALFKKPDKYNPHQGSREMARRAKKRKEESGV